MAAPTTAHLHAATQPALPEWAHLPTHWPVQTDLIDWCQQMNAGTAAVLVLAGIVFLLFGVYLFKGLVTLNAAALGAYLGALAGEHGDAAIAGACLGAFTAAAVTWPLMKWAIAVMGAIDGAILGAAIWHTARLEPSLAWAGALSGLIFFGLINFILFRASVMMYMSLQGSTMLIFGILGLVCKYPDIAARATADLNLKPFILPAAIFVPAILGLLYQQATYGEPAEPKKK